MHQNFLTWQSVRNFLKQFPNHYLEIQEGHQWLLQFGDQYRLSIINHKGSRGYPNLYEIGVFSDCDTMAELPGITVKDDQVKGNLTPNQIDAIIVKMISITGKMPVSIVPTNL